MALEKLQIFRETRGAPKKNEEPKFDKEAAIVALFNPDEISYSGSVGWSTGKAAQRDVPERAFTGGDRTLSVKLLFDTYDTPDQEKKDVRTEYTSKIFELTQVEDAKASAAGMRVILGQSRQNLPGCDRAARAAIHSVHGERHTGTRDAHLHVQGVAHEPRGPSQARVAVG